MPQSDFAGFHDTTFIRLQGLTDLVGMAREGRSLADLAHGIALACLYPIHVDSLAFFTADSASRLWKSTEVQLSATTCHLPEELNNESHPEVLLELRIGQIVHVPVESADRSGRVTPAANGGTESHERLSIYVPLRDGPCSIGALGAIMIVEHDVLPALDSLLRLVAGIVMVHKDTSGQSTSHSTLRTPSRDRSQTLSSRDLQIADLLASGLTTAQAARRIGFSESTVRHSVMRIYATWGISSRSELASRVRQSTRESTLDAVAPPRTAIGVT